MGFFFYFVNHTSKEYTVLLKGCFSRERKIFSMPSGWSREDDMEIMTEYVFREQLKNRSSYSEVDMFSDSEGTQSSDSEMSDSHYADYKKDKYTRSDHKSHEKNESHRNHSKKGSRTRGTRRGTRESSEVRSSHKKSYPRGGKRKEREDHHTSHASHEESHHRRERKGSRNDPLLSLTSNQLSPSPPVLSLPKVSQSTDVLRDVTNDV